LINSRVGKEIPLLLIKATMAAAIFLHNQPQQAKRG
jgi:hypothetical protein